MAGDAVSYTAGSWAQVVPVLLCPGEGSLPEPTLSVLWWTCLQPYLTKAEAWGNESDTWPCRSVVVRLDADSR